MSEPTTGTFALSEFRVHLEEGPRVRPLEITPDFWKQLAPELSGGRIVGASLIRRPEELHPDTWEMHPEGDELLCLISGAIDVVLEDSGGERVVALRAGSATVIEAGIWHRLRLRETGFLVVITRGRGTKMRPVEAALPDDDRAGGVR